MLVWTPCHKRIDHNTWHVHIAACGTCKKRKGDDDRS